MDNKNLPPDELLKEIHALLEKQGKILEKMDSRAQLQAVFFWFRIAMAVGIGVIAVIGAFWYASILRDVMTQIDAVEM